MARLLWILLLVNLAVSIIFYPIIFHALFDMDHQIIGDINEVYNTLYLYDERIAQAETAAQFAADNVAHPYVPAATYDWTEINMVARLIAREVGNSDYRVQMGVAQCVYDRLYCPTYNFGDTITEIIEAPRQFTGGVYQGDLDDFPRAMEATIDVFYNGQRAYDQPVYYFYSKEHVNDKARAWFETLPLVADEGHTIFRGM